MFKAQQAVGSHAVNIVVNVVTCRDPYDVMNSLVTEVTDVDEGPW